MKISEMMFTSRATRDECVKRLLLHTDIFEGIYYAPKDSDPKTWWAGRHCSKHIARVIISTVVADVLKPSREVKKSGLRFRACKFLGQEEKRSG